MVRKLAQRLLWSIVVLIGITAITFFLTHTIPGDPARFAVGLDATEEQVARYRELMGLDRPVIEQYARYLGRLARGDLGVSIVSRRPVLEDIKGYLPASLELVGYTMFVVVTTSVVLGVLAARNAGNLVDEAIRVVSAFGMAVPVFWLGLVLQLIFYSKLGLLPAGGRSDIAVTGGSGILTLDYLAQLNVERLLVTWRHLILPVIALAVPQIAVLTRMMRATLLDVLRSDYIRTAYSKGLADRAVMRRHAIKNGLIPVVTLAGLQFGWMLGGTVIVETIFRWPGLGQYAVYGILNLDYSAVVGTALVITFFFVLINIFIDLSYLWLDPRIRY